jgi:hypothetical protein
VANREEVAIEFVKKYHPTSTKVHVSKTIPVGHSRNAKSHVLYVTYTKDSGRTDRSLVYFPFIGDPLPFDSSEDFIKWYTSKQDEGGILPLLIEWSGGIAGLIAVAIVSVLLWEYAHSPEKFTPPELLAHAFSLILGYYFGSKVTRSASKDSSPD